MVVGPINPRIGPGGSDPGNSEGAKAKALKAKASLSAVGIGVNHADWLARKSSHLSAVEMDLSWKTSPELVVLFFSRAGEKNGGG